METISFENMDNYDLKQYPKLFLRLNSDLLEMGIKKVKCQMGVYEDTFENVLTLHLKPNYHNNSGGWTALRSDCKFRQYLCQLTGNRGDNSGYYYPVEEKEEIVFKDGRVEFKFGCYLPQRNIVIFYFNPLYSDLNLGLEDKYLFRFIEALKDFVSKRKLETKDVSKMIEENMLRKFNKQIDQKLKESRDTINSCYNDISSYQEQLINRRRCIETEECQLEALKKLERVTLDKLKGQVEQIKQLNFVRNVKMDNGEISLEMPDIKIRWKGEDVCMGNYIVAYKPERITIRNEKPLEGDEDLHHPHIRGDSVCFGNRQDKMNEMLSSLKLKQLTYFVYLFLKSYNKDDCFTSITKWTGDEEEEEEQEEECREEEEN